MLRLINLYFVFLITAGVCSTALAQSQGDFELSIVNDRPLSARVLGGAEAQLADFPSVVALLSTGFSSADRRLFCGGTLVAERWVLTAAHCVLDDLQQPREPETIRVLAGFNDLTEPTSDDEVQVIQVVVHPDFDLSLELPPYDIALLEVESDIAAEVGTLFAGDSALYTDALGAIAGWGAIEYSDAFSAVYPTTLQSAIVPLVSHEVCNDPQSYDGILADSHLCAGYVNGQIDACAGDSGGPLYIQIDGKQVQAGIVSFGVGCGLPLFYGIYTDISFFIPWLSHYIAVPEQSSALVQAREQSSTGQAWGGSAGDSFVGNTGYLLLLILLLTTVPRLARKTVTSQGEDART